MSDDPLFDLDPELHPYLGLYGSRVAEHPRVGPCFICEGRYLVEEALKAHRERQIRVLSVLASSTLMEGLRPLIPQEIKTFTVEKSFLEKLLGFSFHRGLLCCVERPVAPAWEQLLKAHRLVVLPRLDNVDNLGQILRTAAALGMDAVLVGQGPGPFDRRTVRVSMGAAWKIPILQTERLPEFLTAWRSQAPHLPTEIVGAALKEEALDASDWRPGARTALMLGPEDQGLDLQWLALCDRYVRIPMSQSMDSLNVAAAGAILMFRMSEKR